MKRRVVICLVLAALMAALFVPARAAPDVYTNGQAEEALTSYKLLGIVHLPEDRFLELVLVTKGDTVLLLVVLKNPRGKQGVLMEW